jgi:RNA 2',3'-cyclic 3'-phosphodiesterase
VIRAFVAIKIDAPISQTIADAIIRLKPRLRGIRWVPATNFHLTLKFLGNIDDAKIDPVSEVLQYELHPFSRFTINAKGLGVFPDLKRPRILWVGLQSTQLSLLAATVEQALEHVGFAVEKRQFKPHLTIGRWRQFDDSKAKLAGELEIWKNHEFGQSEVNEVILFQSMLSSDGAHYRLLKTVPLASDGRHD